jgi:hypothetical protein
MEDGTKKKLPGVTLLVPERLGSHAVGMMRPKQIASAGFFELERLRREVFDTTPPWMNRTAKKPQETQI